MKWVFSPEFVEDRDLYPPSAYRGIVLEGLPVPGFDEDWRFCPDCKAHVAVDRLTLGYGFHMEHVLVVCACCGATLHAFDVLMEANWAPPQLAAG